MLFEWTEKDGTFEYRTSDVFGDITFVSKKPVDPDTCDAIVSALLKVKSSAQTIAGELDSPSGPVRYTFKRAPQWEDIPCEDTPTETKRPAKRSIATHLASTPIWSWFKRYVGAFRAAVEEFQVAIRNSKR